MNGTPVGSFDAITIDCLDPKRLAEFWCQVFETKVDTRNGDPVHYIDLLPAAGAPTLRLQRVPEAKTIKARLHLDILVDDLDHAVKQVESLGAVRAENGQLSEYGYSFQVMLDPEGNEFCLVRRED